jgi:hypothetical protein
MTRLARRPGRAVKSWRVAGQLLAGGDAELREGPVQVVAHGARGQEQLGADLLVGRAGGRQPDELQFLRGELGQRVIGRDNRLPGAGGAQLGLGAFPPGPGAYPREGGRGSEQVLAGVGAALVTAQPLAVQQAGARLLERAAVALVGGDRPPVVRLGVAVAGGQRGAPRPERWPTADRSRRPTW